MPVLTSLISSASQINSGESVSATYVWNQNQGATGELVNYEWRAPNNSILISSNATGGTIPSIVLDSGYGDYTLVATPSNSANILGPSQSITVKVLLNTTTSSAIVAGLGSFNGPLTVTEATTLGVSYSQQTTQKGENWALFTHSQAITLCATLGARLPTSNELLALHSQYGNSWVPGWPEGVYSSSNSGTFGFEYLYTLDGTIPGSVDPNNPHFVTCIDDS